MGMLPPCQDGDLLKLNFDISFPKLSCEFASVDVSDVLGMNRYNLTKTVRKRPIDAAGTIIGDAFHDRQHGIKHETIVEEELPPADALAEGLAAAAPVHEEALKPATYAAELDEGAYSVAVKRYPVLLVNFYAPWCPWSRRLEPVWEATAKRIAEDPQMAGVVSIAKVDCTEQGELCRANHIQGFPSIRIYRGGSDSVDGNSMNHASYMGDRTVDAFLSFISGILPARPQQVLQALPAGQAPQLADLRAATMAGLVVTGQHPGCAIDGFVLVKKVPGSLFVTAHSASHSFTPGEVDLTHAVHGFWIGKHLVPWRIAELKRLVPGGLPDNWADKLAGLTFRSVSENTTHEHYLQARGAASLLRRSAACAQSVCANEARCFPDPPTLSPTQVVRTTVEPLHSREHVPKGVRASHGAAGSDAASLGHIDAYEYTVHSHSYQVEGMPRAKFSFSLSPMQVVVRVRCLAHGWPCRPLLCGGRLLRPIDEAPGLLQEEGRYGFYHFMTTVSAIIGGVFTVASLFDSVTHHTIRYIRKGEIGKIH